MIEFFQNFDIQIFLARYGYVAILLFTFLEGETIVILAGIAATHGMLEPVWVAACAFTGSCSSDQIMFSLGKYKGQDVLRWMPKIQNRLTRAADLMQRYDVAFILGFRFVYGVRNITPIMLGLSGVAHLKFFALNVTGALIWAAAFTASGYYLGQACIELVGQIGTSIIYAVIFVVMLLAAVHCVRRYRGTRS
jgi:membrane protein DedA with SNARE-associated domain